VPAFLSAKWSDYFLAAAFLAGAAAGLAATAFLAGAAAFGAAAFTAGAAAGFAATAFLTGVAALVAAALGTAAFLAGVFAGLAAGMSDSSINEGFGRKAFCLRYFHAFKRRGRIVNKKKRAPQGLARVFQ
jgi:hypothetical protein